MAGKTSVPAAAHDAVLRTSATGEDHGERVSGYDFNHGLDLQALLRSMHTTGFQASHLGQAVEEVNRMLDWRLSDEPIMETTSDEQKDLAFRKTVKCKIFLGCTSNIISSGVRETIRFLLEHRMVSSTILSLFSCLIHICLSLCSEVFLNLFQFFVFEFLGFEVAQDSSHGFSS